MYYSIIYFIIIALLPYLSTEESEEIIHNRFSAKTYAVKALDSNNENEETPENISILGGMPSGMINGCVNVITGTYIDSSVDLVTVGAENLVVERIYSSDSEGWEINQSEYIFSRFGLKHCQKGGVTTYNSAKEFLDGINANEKIRPYLVKYPLTIDNVEVTLFFRENQPFDKENNQTRVVSIENGNVYFKYENKIETRGYSKIENETYEEAVKKLQSSNPNSI